MVINTKTSEKVMFHLKLEGSSGMSCNGKASPWSAVISLGCACIVLKVKVEAGCSSGIQKALQPEAGLAALLLKSYRTKTGNNLGILKWVTGVAMP